MSGPLRVNCERGLSGADLRGLDAGDTVELTGCVLTLRDASAARLVSAEKERHALPVALAGQVMYAVGPSPPKPGEVVGSAGPTTTARLAPYLPALLASGVRGIIGKGELHGDAAAAFVQYGAVYFAAIGGLGALLAKHIVRADVVAYPDLGPEAVYRFEVVDFPLTVIIDLAGRNFHETARARWRRTADRSS
ncbi:MAG: fumarate hydratase C-terminal domain-containing protein [Acidobacteria bacterium]|nr:fumarate hydratase C-terminal domain-containing protein [Acidobacteriota bacterium]